LKNGKKTNPMKVKMPSGRKLKGQELELFLATMDKSNKTFTVAESVSNTTLASAD
jgi:hypothetical protein